jgi:hypothetical protein
MNEIHPRVRAYFLLHTREFMDEVLQTFDFLEPHLKGWNKDLICQVSMWLTVATLEIKLLGDRTRYDQLTSLICK